MHTHTHTHVMTSASRALNTYTYIHVHAECTYIYTHIDVYICIIYTTCAPRVNDGQAQTKIGAILPVRKVDSAVDQRQSSMRQEKQRKNQKKEKKLTMFWMKCDPEGHMKHKALYILKQNSRI